MNNLMNMILDRANQLPIEKYDYKKSLKPFFNSAISDIFVSPINKKLITN